MRSAYGLDTVVRDDHWSRQAECRHNPDAFFAADGQAHWRPREALHVCRVHCPVLDRCRDFAETQAPPDRVSTILGGVAYDCRGQPAREARWNAVPISCPDCRNHTPLLAAEPARHGSLAAVRWHRENGQALCPACRHGEKYRAADRIRARARRREERMLTRWMS